MKINYGEGFKRQLKRLAKRYRFVKTDIKPVLDSLEAGETPGDQLIGHSYALYKVRLKNSDNKKGKSGGYRVIYYLKTDEDCSLVTIYSKSDQGDIAQNELESLVKDIVESEV
jgi:mRNA-degrading endonuclease RelE of RelBE toxin-antitoxin system